MTKELTQQKLTRVFSAYLPYNVEFISETDNNKYLLTDIKSIDEYAIWACKKWNEKSLKYEPEINAKPNGQLGSGFKFNQIKPILYDLSMLTKEITHEGKTFIPIERLFDIETGINWSNSDYIKSDSGKDEYWVRSKEEGMSFYFGYNCENNYFYHIGSDGFKKLVKHQLEMFQKLFEWHFNIFGLDDSQYINKATLILEIL